MNRMMRMCGRSKRQQGLVIIASYSLFVMLTILGSAMLVRGLSENSIGMHSASGQRALHLSEAGVDQAIDQMRGTNMSNITTTSLGSGTYAAEIFDNTTFPSLSSSQRVILGHGTYGAWQRDVETLTELTAQSIFQFALFGETSVTVNGNALTDSYSSAGGVPYNPANAGHNGDVGTNSTAAGAITVNGGGNAAINGQLIVGEGGDPSVVATLNGTVLIAENPGEPEITTQPSNLSIPPVSVPAGLICASWTVGSGGPPSQDIPNPALVAAGTCNASGECCFTDLTIMGGGSITPTLAVSVYVTGAFSADGNTSFGVPTDPSQLIMYLTGNTSTATLQGSVSGHSEFYGGIYAPNGNVNIDGYAEIYGSVIADNVTINGSAQIHYDEAMVNTGPVGGYDVDVLEWREVN